MNMKETWNLRESVMNAISEATCCRIYEDPSEKEIGDRLVNEICINFKCPKLQDDLNKMEEAALKLGNEVFKLKSEIVKLNEEIENLGCGVSEAAWKLMDLANSTCKFEQ